MSTVSKSVDIPLSHIKAALLFALKGDPTRARLSGVCIEFGPLGTRMVATDGYRLIAISLNTDSSESVSCILARDVLETACKAFSKQRSIPFTWERDSKPDPEREGVTVVSVARVTIGGLATEDVQDKHGAFPEWERVIPRVLSGTVAQFNPYYLADCARARELLCDLKKGNGQAFVAHNGNAGALVHLADCAFAVVMPMRGDADITLPAWFTGPQANDSPEKLAA